MVDLSDSDRCGPERPTRLIRIKEVQYRTGLGRSTIYRWMAQGRFPRPFQLGIRSVAWPEESIQHWIDQQR
jgi:prophage regulatory protein